MRIDKAGHDEMRAVVDHPGTGVQIIAPFTHLDNFAIRNLDARIRDKGKGAVSSRQRAHDESRARERAKQSAANPASIDNRLIPDAQAGAFCGLHIADIAGRHGMRQAGLHINLVRMTGDQARRFQNNPARRCSHIRPERIGGMAHCAARQYDLVDIFKMDRFDKKGRPTACPRNIADALLIFPAFPALPR